MKCFGLGFAGALLLVLLAVVIGPQYGSYTARAQTSEWLALLKPIQAQIEANALKQRSMNEAGSQIAPPDFRPQNKPVRFEIRTTGEILILGNDVMLLLTPSLDSSVSSTPAAQPPVAWHCAGAPQANVPLSCR